MGGQTEVSDARRHCPETFFVHNHLPENRAADPAAKPSYLQTGLGGSFI